MSLLPLRRPLFSRTTYLILFACYIGIFLNLAFYRQVFPLLPVNSLHNWLVFLSMPIVAISVMNIITTLASVPEARSGGHQPVYSAQRVGAVLYLELRGSDRPQHDHQYPRHHSGGELCSALRRNDRRTRPLGVLAVFVAWWVKIRKPATRWRGAAMRLLNIAVSALLIILVAALFYKDYASVFRNNKELVKSLSPSNSIVALNSWYAHNRMDNLPLVKIGEDARQKPVMHSGPRKNLTIVVLGETSRAGNFSLGGYDRETNPRLQRDDVVYFPKTTSCGTATAVSVPCMFSNMPRAHYDEELAHHQEGVLDILQRAGVQVLWNDNDGGCKGACDRVPHQNVTDLHLSGQCIDGECYDEVLFHNLDSYIDNLKQDGIIVLHTIGSHGPTYYNRYPAEFKKFTPTCDTNEIQSCTQQQLTNTYDNTILYVDYVVDKAIKLLQSKQDKFTTSLVYLSDHGESLGEDGVYLHGLPYSIAPDTQKHVPMLLWLSPDYQQRYGVSSQCLQQQAKTKDYSQDNLFSTLLGLLGVSTHEYQAADDILTPCREAG